VPDVELLKWLHDLPRIRPQLRSPRRPAVSKPACFAPPDRLPRWQREAASWIRERLPCHSFGGLAAEASLARQLNYDGLFRRYNQRIAAIGCQALGLGQTKFLSNHVGAKHHRHDLV